jgi:hypothetical protein
VRFAIALAILSCQHDQAPQGTGSDCAVVAQRIQAAVQPQIDAVGKDAKTMIAKMIPAMQTSCVDDKWPAPLTSCIVAAKPGNLAALQQCNSLMPKDLQDKLQKRIMMANPLAKP